MKLHTLFETLNSIEYQTTGNGVDYQFIEEGRRLYIYFEGSKQKVDWLRNFTFPAKPYKDMGIPYRVHRGFLKCWKEVEDIIIAKITEKTGEEFKYNSIIVAGYSHGGALAQFCHECVWFWRPDIREHCWSYGFEAPRIYAGFSVKPELRERWANYTLVRNHKDLVTHVPPRLFGFCDLGAVLHIGRFQDYSDFDVKPNLECIKSHYPQKVDESLRELNIQVGAED